MKLKKETESKFIDIEFKFKKDFKDQMYYLAMLEDTITLNELFTQSQVNSTFKDTVIAAYAKQKIKELLNEEVKSKTNRERKKTK